MKTTSLTKTVSSKTSNSLRTSVPAWLIEYFGLRKGDKFGWSLNQNRITITILKKGE